MNMLIGDARELAALLDHMRSLLGWVYTPEALADPEYGEARRLEWERIQREVEKWRLALIGER